MSINLSASSAGPAVKIPLLEERGVLPMQTDGWVGFIFEVLAQSTSAS